MRGHRFGFDQVAVGMFGIGHLEVINPNGGREQRRAQFVDLDLGSGKPLADGDRRPAHQRIDREHDHERDQRDNQQPWENVRPTNHLDFGLGISDFGFRISDWGFRMRIAERTNCER